MARPVRRVIVGLATKMHKSVSEVSSWPMEDIRDLVATLLMSNRPPDKSPKDQTQEEIVTSFSALTSNVKLKE